MNKLITTTMAVSALSATSLFSQVSDFYSTTTLTGSGGSGSVTLNNAISSAGETWVFAAYGREGGASTAAGHNVTSFSFGGNTLSQIVEGVVNPTNGSRSTLEIWGAKVTSDIATGATAFTFGGDVDEEANVAFWIVDNVASVRDQAIVGIVDTDSPNAGNNNPDNDAGTIGFNGSMTFNPDDTGTYSDQDFSDVMTGDVVLGWYLSGNTATNGGDVNGLDGALTITDAAMFDGPVSSYSTAAASGVATADGQAVGFDIDESWFRAGAAFVAVAVPESSSYSLLAGALVLGVVSMRRRRA